MLYAVVEEIWSLAGSDEEAKLLQLLGPVDAKDGSESAAIRAKELASKFDHSGSEEGARYLYYWGRNDGGVASMFTVGFSRREYEQSGAAGGHAAIRPNVDEFIRADARSAVRLGVTPASLSQGIGEPSTQRLQGRVTVMNPSG